ncbi:MFS transporter [Rhodobacterales bacterium HKCCE2091]|nr:MFS transporter [Rhodobacterales bacterium HKCCE2091]
MTDDTDARRLHYGWVIVALAFVSTAMVLGARFSMGLFLPFLPEAFDTSAASVSAAVAISMLGAAAIQPLVGISLDRFGGRTVFAVGLLFAGAALCGTALATEFWQVVLLMGLATSVGYASLSPVSSTTLVSGWFDRNRGTALGIATSGTKVAMIVLPPTLAALIVAYDWRRAMLVLGLAILALIPPVLAFMRGAPGIGPSRKGGTARPAADGDHTTARQAMRLPAFWVISACLFANGLMMNLVFVHLPSYVMSRGFDTALAATGLALVGGIGIFGTVVTGWLSDRLGPRLVLLLMFGARALATLLVVLMPATITFAAFVLVFGFLGYGAIGVIASLATNLFGRRAIGTILGFAYVFNQTGGAIGTFAGGASLEWTGSYDAALWLTIVTTLLALPGIWLLAGRSRGPEAGRS